MEDKKQEMLSALYKRAVGYKSDEVVEEYAVDEENNQKLIKRKKTIKIVPPDITATKLYFELVKSEDEFENLSNEQIEQEIKKIMDELNKNKNC